jgi:hypothetical protein
MCVYMVTTGQTEYGLKGSDGSVGKKGKDVR